MCRLVGSQVQRRHLSVVLIRDNKNGLEDVRLSWREEGSILERDEEN